MSSYVQDAPTVYVVGEPPQAEDLLIRGIGSRYPVVHVEHFGLEVPPGSIVLWASFKDPSVVKAADQTHMLILADNIARTLRSGLDHALAVKANLILDFAEPYSRLLDPLGNLYVPYTANFPFLGVKAVERAIHLQTFTRIQSVRAIPTYTVPPFQDEAFSALCRETAARFSRLTSPWSKRALGAVTAFDGNHLFVSRRNLDKTTIKCDDFVPCGAADGTEPVQFVGPNKPSVDAPVFRRLLARYPRTRYIIHGHVYVNEAPFTQRFVPCGALEEADEVCEVLPCRGTPCQMSVNLRGHGCLFLAGEDADMDFIREATLSQRPSPEIG